MLNGYNNKKKAFLFAIFIIFSFCLIPFFSASNTCDDSIDSKKIEYLLSEKRLTYDLIQLYNHCKEIGNFKKADFIFKSLTKILNNEKKPIEWRKNAVSVLAKIQEPRAISLLIDILKDTKKDFKVRKAIALETHTFPLETVCEIIENSSIDASIRKIVIEDVWFKHERGKLIPTFLKIMKNGSEDLGIRKLVLRCLRYEIRRLRYEDVHKEILSTAQKIWDDEEEDIEMKIEVAYLLHEHDKLKSDFLAKYMIDIWRSSEDTNLRRNALRFCEEISLKSLPDKSKEDIAIRAAHAINNLINKKKSSLANFYEDAAILINKLHDRDDQRDLVRTKIIENLNAKTTYYLIALGGPRLYTSTFFKLYEKFSKEQIVPKLKSLDPNGEYHNKFILTLASFGVSEQILEEDPIYFLKIIEKILKDEKDINNGCVLASPISLILENKNGRFGNINTKMQELLLNLYKEYKKRSFYNGTAVIGYFIKSNKKFFQRDFKTKAEEISKELPEILEPKVPEEWFEDNKITAKLYFYSDENSFEDARNYYAKQIGIKNVKSIGKKIIVLELNYNNEVKLKKESIRDGVNIRIDGNKVEIYLGKAQKAELEVLGSGPNKGIIFLQDGSTIIKKRINKIDFEIILTKIPVNKYEDFEEDVKRSLTDPTIDIIAHRGHSYHLDKTFPQIQIDCKKKLLYLGSCGSYRDIPELRKYYSNCYYIADKDIGRGMENNRILDALLFSIGKGERNWKNIKEIIEKNVKPSGIVYPTDEGMLCYDFVEKFLRKYKKT